MVHDLLAWRDARLERAEVLYWRTVSGTDVDFVVETDGRLLPIEVKASARPRLADAKHLRTFRAEYGKRAHAGLLLHTGSEVDWLAPDVLAEPWWKDLLSDGMRPSRYFGQCATLDPSVNGGRPGSGPTSLRSITYNVLALRGYPQDERNEEVRALEDGEQRVRKAAVLALGRFGTSDAETALRGVVADDPAPDVAGAALVALARSGADVTPALLSEVMERDCWYEELAVAGLEAIEALARPELLTLVRPYAAAPHNQSVRSAALRAWAALSPSDAELRRVLLALLDSPSYDLQQQAMGMVGELFVEEARPALEDIVELDFDANLTQVARQSLGELDRLAAHASR